jgi:fructose-bisphosphate aldolase class II
MAPEKHKTWVATGRSKFKRIFNYALKKEKDLRTSSKYLPDRTPLIVSLETAAKLNAPVIIQFSNGGAQFNAGKGLSNAGEKAAIAGGIQVHCIFIP